MTGFVVQVDLVLRKLFFSMYLLSMLKIVVLLNIFVETLIYTFQDYLMKKKQHFFERETFCYIVNVFTFNQFNAFLLNKTINLF